MRKERGPQKACKHGQYTRYRNLAAKTYGSNGLHAQDEGVLGEVAGVAEGVLLPELAKQVLHAAHVPEVVGKVALEERVDAAAQHEPHHDGHIGIAGVGSRPHQDCIRDAEDGSAARGEHADQLKRVPLVGHVAHDLDAERVVRVQRRCGGCIEGHGGTTGLDKLYVA